MSPLSLMPLEQRLHGGVVAGLGGADEVVVGDVEAVPRGPEPGGVAVGLLLGGEPGLLGRLGHLQAVLVGAGEEVRVVAEQAVPAGERVGDHRRVGVPDVGRVVDVVDRRRDVEAVGHPSSLRGGPHGPRRGCLADVAPPVVRGDEADTGDDRRDRGPRARGTARCRDSSITRSLDPLLRLPERLVEEGLDERARQDLTEQGRVLRHSSMVTCWRSSLARERLDQHEDAEPEGQDGQHEGHHEGASHPADATQRPPTPASAVAPGQDLADRPAQDLALAVAETAAGGSGRPRCDRRSSIRSSWRSSTRRRVPVSSSRLFCAPWNRLLDGVDGVGVLRPLRPGRR